METHETIQRVVDNLADQRDFTTKERELLPYFVSGLGYDDIAAENFVATKTIKNHAANIFHKLKVKNRQQLMVLVLNHILQQQEVENKEQQGHGLGPRVFTKSMRRSYNENDRNLAFVGGHV